MIFHVASFFVFQPKTTFGCPLVAHQPVLGRQIWPSSFPSYQSDHRLENSVPVSFVALSICAVRTASRMQPFTNGTASSVE